MCDSELAIRLRFHRAGVKHRARGETQSLNEMLMHENLVQMQILTPYLTRYHRKADIVLGITLGNSHNITVKLRVDQKFMVYEWGIQREDAGPLGLIKKSWSIDGLGNQEYNLSAICEENGTEIAHANSTFSVDVRVDMNSAEGENEEEEKARWESLALFGDQDKAAVHLGMCHDLGLQRRSMRARLRGCYPFWHELALLQMT